MVSKWMIMVSKLFFVSARTNKRHHHQVSQRYQKIILVSKNNNGIKIYYSDIKMYHKSIKKSYWSQMGAMVSKCIKKVSDWFKKYQMRFFELPIWYQVGHQKNCCFFLMPWWCRSRIGRRCWFCWWVVDESLKRVCVLNSVLRYSLSVPSRRRFTSSCTRCSSSK